MKLFHRIAASAVVAGLAFAPAAASAQQFINVLTGGTSGVYYPLGVALAKVYADNIEGVKTQVQSTKASVENVNLVTQGRGEIAFALGDTVKAAAEGNADAGFQQPVENLRAIAAIYPNYVQIVASQESGITDLAGLKGKALSVGAPASGTELNARAIFGAAEMSYDDLGKTEYLPFAESVELIKNRQLDATLQSAGLGVASIRDLASSLPITVVAVPAEIAEKLGAPFAAAEIPAGTYDGQDAAVPTAGDHQHSRDLRGSRRGTCLPDDQAALREPAGARRRPQRGRGHRPEDRRQEPAGRAASGCGALLQGSRPALI